MPLFFTSDDKTGQNRNHRSVHRHRDADLIQWNAVEQNFHIFDAVNRHARFANIAFDPWVVAVITTVGCQIKRH